MTFVFAVYTCYRFTKLPEQFFHAGVHLLGHPDRSNEEVIRCITSWVQTAPLPDHSVILQVRFISIHLQMMHGTVRSIGISMDSSTARSNCPNGKIINVMNKSMVTSLVSRSVKT